MSIGDLEKPIAIESPVSLQTGMSLQNDPGDSEKGRNGTDRRRNQGFEAKGRAVHGERRPGAFAGHTAKRQNVLAVSLSLGRQARKGESRGLSRSDLAKGAGEERRAGCASGKRQVSRRGIEAKARWPQHESHRQRVWGAVLQRAGNESLERPENHPALSGQRNFSHSWGKGPQGCKRSRRASPCLPQAGQWTSSSGNATPQRDKADLRLCD